ncbi:MAG: glycosyltransferase family 2 protein [Bacteroidetes bacterium]|nr:glycosyltransferase family 2 protein [Bacteroidota bacterium]
MEQVNLNVVVSVYNEQESLPFFYKEIKKQLNLLDISYKIIFINDGSIDRSIEILREFAEKDTTVKVINFSRNFGHEAAMLAGIDYSDADAVIFMDSDLQHPPACIKKMMQTFNNGADIINMIREERKDGGFQKNLMSKLFYVLLNKISKIKIEHNASDFFLLSKRVVKILKEDYRERTRFLRGLIQIIGFNKEKLSFTAPKRIAGKSKYSFMKLLVFSFSAISVLSKAPLHLGIFSGLIFAFFSIIVTIYSVVMRFLNQPAPGYTTLVVLISLLFSILFFILGIIGDYIGLLFDEIKKRPNYIVMEEISNNTNNLH